MGLMSSIALLIGDLLTKLSLVRVDCRVRILTTGDGPVVLTDPGYHRVRESFNSASQPGAVTNPDLDHLLLHHNSRRVWNERLES